MPEIVSNALVHASSAYLRSAMHQPVQWEPWGEAAFARAAAENKPVLLDIGAVWCHWCHVMDHESYEDAEIAGIINEHFVAVKVDRDERPDVDARYQAAVAAISGQSGWPLTAFLTPEGKPFFGGTYFPPDDRYGRPGLKRVLLMMAGSFEHNRDEVDESAASVMDAIEQSEMFEGGRAELEAAGAAESLVERMIGSMLQQFDPLNGGFGSQPKFPHPAAISLLVDAASRGGARAQKSGEAALLSLKKMARGGICDQLAGGFHRYSVDERWVVPHFEKMSYDNSELLRAYTHAFQTFVDPELAEAARGVVRWMDETLTDRERGGFFGSQDADLAVGDDGGYFTWTKTEAAEVLDPGELKLAEVYFDIGAVGDMKHDPARNVLFRPMTPEAAAQAAGMPAAVGPQIIKSIRAKLLAARRLRPAPFVDRTIYTGWNAMCVSAYLEAGRVLQMPATVAFALKSLDRVLDSAFDNGSVAHVVAYSDPAAPVVNVPGMLDDYVFLGVACLDAWGAAGERRYFAAAEQIAEALLSRFYDGRGGGGFFDTAVDAPDRLGALGARRKPLQDSPTPGGNPAAAVLLFRLHALTGKAEYRDAAEETLEAFAGVVEHMGLYAATFGLALGRLSRPAVQVVIAGEGEGAAAMEMAALAGFAVNRTVVRVRAGQWLPPVLAETVPGLPEDGVVALICSGERCLPPVRDVEGLVRALSEVG